ncbi:invasion associated locus B family protein [Ancylobacter sp.]|uniref:invasion associated locus B family protein n=1 Tax=Ancylobacter sp. TaxID=1872567 RepID=UPI003D0A45F7
MAATPTALGEYKDWSAWRFNASGKSQCYAISAPTAKQPERLAHGDVTFFVTALDGTAQRTEVSFQTGYEFASGSQVVASIGDDTFTLMTEGNSAWLRRAEREAAFLEAMRGGSEMNISATSRRGNETSYVFSLNGATAATNAILQRCR